MSREVCPPMGSKQGNKFVVQVGLSVCVGAKPILDIRSGVGVTRLRHEGGLPISLPLKIPECPSHLLNSELHLLLISFSPCLTLHPLDTVKILTVCIKR